jgi:predicted transposase/invertase (TIGR01784 family)
MFDRVFAISICDYTLCEDEDAAAAFAMLSLKTYECFNGDENTVVVQLAKADGVFKKPVETMTDVEKWLAFLRSADDPKRMAIVDEIAESKEEIKMAVQELNAISRDPKERLEYFLRQVQADKEREKTRGLTLEQRVESFIEGEKKERYNNAVKMIKKGFDNQFIQEIIELTDKEIDDIRKEIEAEKESAKTENFIEVNRVAIKMIQQGHSNQSIGYLLELSENEIEDLRKKAETGNENANDN